MKTYIVEFTLTDGTKQEVSLTTDRLEWSIDQWCRNRNVANHKVLNEGTLDRKQMLLG